MFLIKNTDDDAERIAHGRLRYEVYVEEKKWIDPNTLSGDREVDEFDEQSTLMVAYDLVGDPVGCLRVIHQGPIALPVERAPFNIPISAERRCAEISRLAVRREHRGNEILLAGLFRQATQILSDHSVEDVYALVERPLFALLKYMGFPFVELGSPLEFFGGYVMPTRLHLDEVAESVRIRRPKYAKLYDSRFDGWIDAEMCE